MTAPVATAIAPRPLASASDRSRPVARAGKKAFSVWIDPATAKVAKRIMTELDITVQQAMEDAMRDWIERNRSVLPS
jgi:hypothetical protein